MKTYSKKSTNSIAFIFALFIFTIASYSLYEFNVAVNFQLKEATTNKLYQVAAQQKITINNAISEAKSDLLLLVESISNSEFSSGNIQEYLNTQIKNTTLKNLIFININKSDKSEALKKLQDNIQNSDNELSIHLVETSSKDNTVLGLSKPIYKNGKLEGLLIAQYPLNEFTSNLKTIVGDEGYAVIVDRLGETIYSTKSSAITLKTLENEKVEFLNGQTAEKIRQDHIDRKDGVVEFLHNNITYIGAYKSLNFNDWVLGIVVDINLAQKDLKSISSSLVIVSVFIFVCLILLGTYIWYAKITALKDIRNALYYDKLTGAPNLIKFKEDITKILKEHPEEEFGIVKMDFRNFKAVNDMYGFKVGDDILKANTETCRQACKSSKFARFCRAHADQFIVFLPKPFVKNLKKNTEHLDSYLKEKISVLKDFHFETVFGRYYIEPNETDVDDIVHKVGMAHNYAKNQKIEKICDYDINFKTKALTAAHIANRKEDALKNSEFKLYLQPKFRLIDNKINGAEALVRWIEPNGNIISPSVFVPLFETNGFVVHLDMFILEETCKNISKWIQEGYESYKVSVNFSRYHIYNPNFVKDIIKIVDKYDLPHKYIEIELTETSLIDESKEEMLDILLNEMHDAGFTISIDDFGAGYSSLGFLKNFKVDTLKLDRSFFVNNRYEQRGKSVVDGIMKLANSLDMYVVAEGVEEQEQIDFLKSVNCQSVQGYFYEKPMPVEKFEIKYIKKIDL